MALFLINRSSEVVSVGLLLYDPGCTAENQPWRKMGWWVVEPGHTVVPDALAVDLRTRNRFTGLYAYTGSRSMDWQGTERAWFPVTDGAAFDQCGRDNANCPRWVDFVVIDAAGNPNILTNLGPNANQVISQPPAISVRVGIGDPFGAEFYVSGRGFVPGTTITIGWTYDVNGGSTAQNAAAATLDVGSDGSFATIVACSWVVYAGALSVLATDNAFGLSATTSVEVS